MRSCAISLFTQPMRKVRRVSPQPHAESYGMPAQATGAAQREIQSGPAVRELYTMVISPPEPMSEHVLHPYNRTLTSMQGYKRAGTVAISALDTVVLPVRCDDACRRLLFEQRRCSPVILSGEKLQNLKYAAFCFGSPVGAITHYAIVRSYTPAPGAPHKTILHFSPPEALGKTLEWQQGGALCCPRYTAFAMMLEAKSIEELFGN